MTLDVIGEAVFTQLFHSRTSQRGNAFRLVQAMIPILRLVVPAKMFSIGRELVEQSKDAVIKETAGEPLSGRRDILSLLVKANMAADIPERQRLSGEEVIGHYEVRCFLINSTHISPQSVLLLHGHFTLNPKAQMKLREEVLAVSSDTPSMDELNNLVYLEHARYGGQTIHVPLLAVNTDKEIWGPDAEEFKPERWANVPKAVQNAPGMWANLLTFFAGPHNCIGFRFTLVEQKALLFTLIRAFEFENAVPEGGIGRSSAALQRPIVLADKNNTGQMPLIVKRHSGC
ncbi:cytochrome P450 [Mycena sanguinolenta]|nr:cytochrome P450 [Mycena sanguinolenta]